MGEILLLCFVYFVGAVVQGLIEEGAEALALVHSIVLAVFVSTVVVLVVKGLGH